EPRDQESLTERNLNSDKNPNNYQKIKTLIKNTLIHKDNTK
ncbi:MAG: hypothetical protein ACJAU1_001902, partial [Psychromonas sp.]